MNKIKEYVPIGGTLLTLLVLLTLLIIQRIDWGTFIASLPGLAVVFNVLNSLFKGEEESIENKIIKNIKE